MNNKLELMSKEMGGVVLWVNNPTFGQAVSLCVLLLARDVYSNYQYQLTQHYNVRNKVTIQS